MNIITNKMPLYDALITYINKNMVSMHMPGHKQGKGIPDEFKEHFFEIDLTELGGLDNLHHPEGAIREAQEMAAQAFGAKQSFFLVNGATCGIQAMIASVCNPGDELIVDRNCHGAVISALILMDVTPRFVHPQYNWELGIVGGISPESIENALCSYPKARGVLVTSPTYYGICSDIEKIARIVHEHHRILLVDEAHGAHFCFHKGLPQSAMEAGADICVQGAHKTLPALTQSAFLHLKSEKIDKEKLQRNLKLFQSSSPSYLLMAYLDIARALMQSKGYSLLDNLLKQLQSIRKEINHSSNIYCLGAEIIGKDNINAVDLTRLVFNFSNTGFTGYEAAKQLNDKDNIQVEMADINNIVCIVSAADTEDELNRLYEAVIGLTGTDKRVQNRLAPLTASHVAITPRMAHFSESEYVPLYEGIHKVCADMVSSFPPGIPILCPGEIITDDIIEYISNIKSHGGNIAGLSNNGYIRTVKEKNL